MPWAQGPFKRGREKLEAASAGDREGAKWREERMLERGTGMMAEDLPSGKGITGSRRWMANEGASEDLLGEGQQGGPRTRDERPRETR